jgi:hypothetical protein
LQHEIITQDKEGVDDDRLSHKGGFSYDTIEKGLMAMALIVAPVAQIMAKTVPNARYPHRISTQFPL